MVTVVDNFLPEEMYEKLNKDFKNPPLTYGWKSSKESDAHGHWNLNFTRSGGNNLANVVTRLPDNLVEIWEYVRNTYSLQDHLLLRSYINGHTYGVDGYFHRDSTRKDEVTIVIYLCDRWNVNWAGDTCFADDTKETVVGVASPKRNRGVIFNSNVWHCARGVSRKFDGLRKTFMFKARAKRSFNFEKLSAFLFKNGALEYKHQLGSLHDHLVRVFQLLENRGLPEHVCFGGGLHSVFGTNAFTNTLFKEEHKEVLKDFFSPEAVELAELFSKINRPKTLENPEEIFDGYTLKLNDGDTIDVDYETFKNLCWIECANLADQNSLNIDRNPNLCKMWNQEDDKQEQ